MEEQQGIAERLRAAAQEIANEGHDGWGNLCVWAADELNRLRTREREVFEAGFRARNVNLGWRFDGDRPYAPEAYAAYLTQAERKDGE